MEESSSGLESEPGAALAAVNNFVAGKEELPEAQLSPALDSSGYTFWKSFVIASFRSNTIPVAHKSISSSDGITAKDRIYDEKLLKITFEVISMVRGALDRICTSLVMKLAISLSYFAQFMLLVEFLATFTIGLEFIITLSKSVIDSIVYCANPVVFTIFWLNIDIVIPLLLDSTSIGLLIDKTITIIVFVSNTIKLNGTGAWDAGIRVQILRLCSLVFWTISSSQYLLFPTFQYVHFHSVASEQLPLHSDPTVKERYELIMLEFLIARMRKPSKKVLRELREELELSERAEAEFAANLKREEEENEKEEKEEKKEEEEELKHTAAPKALLTSTPNQPPSQLFSAQPFRLFQIFFLLILCGSTAVASPNRSHGSSYVASVSPSLASLSQSSSSSTVVSTTSPPSSKRSHTTSSNFDDEFSSAEDDGRFEEKANESNDEKNSRNQPNNSQKAHSLALEEDKRKKKKTKTQEEKVDDEIDELDEELEESEVEGDIVELLDDIAAVDDCGLDNDDPEDDCASDNGPTRVSAKILPTSMLPHFPSITSPLLYPRKSLPSVAGRPPALLASLVAHQRESPRRLNSDEAQAANQAQLDRYQTFPSILQYEIRPKIFHFGDLVDSHENGNVGINEFVAGSAPRGLSLVTYPVDQNAGNLAGKPSKFQESAQMFKKSSWSTKLPDTPIPKHINHSFKVMEAAHRLLPKKLRKFMMAMDTDPVPRDNNLGSKFSRRNTVLSATLAFESISLLKIKEVVIHQAFNRQILIQHGILPSWKYEGVDGNVVYCWEGDGKKEAFEKNNGNGIKISELSVEEKESYWWDNVLDVGDGKTSAIFVKEFRGRQSIIFIFAPHPCIIDPARHLPAIVSKAIVVIEAAYRRLAEDLSIPSSLMTSEFHSSVASLAPQSKTVSPLRKGFPNNGKGYYNAYGRHGTMADMIILRRMEVESRVRSDQSTWSPILEQKVRLACGRYYVEDYSVEKGIEIDSKKIAGLILPYSNLAFAIQSARLGQLTQLAGYEIKEANGTFTAREKDILDSCKKAPLWRRRLSWKYGLTYLEIRSKQRFLIAHERRAAQRMNDPIWHLKLRYNYASDTISACGPRALHLWSLHHFYSVEDYNGAFNYQNQIRYFAGFNASPQPDGSISIIFGTPIRERQEVLGIVAERESRSYSKALRFGNQCEDCADEGLKCIVTYEEGLEWMIEKQGEDFEVLEAQLLNYIIVLERTVARLCRKIHVLDPSKSTNKLELVKLEEKRYHAEEHLKDIERILFNFRDNWGHLCKNEKKRCK